MKVYVLKRESDGQYLTIFGMGGRPDLTSKYSTELHEAIRYSEETMPIVGKKHFVGYASSLLGEEHRLVSVVKRKGGKQRLDKKVVYIAHQLSGSLREQNLQSAKKWALWAAEHMDVAPIADWTILASQWDESKRELGLAIDVALVHRSDEVWLCGPTVSPGMQVEQLHGLVVRDFTTVNFECFSGLPPKGPIDLATLPRTRWTKP
jgi:hypothetical protein